MRLVKIYLLSLSMVLMGSSSFSQDFSFELSNTVFRSTFKTDQPVFDVKSTLNTSTNFSILRKTNFGKIYIGVGYTTLNYFTQVKESWFAPPDDLPIQVDLEKRKKTGHQFISIPFGVRFQINESFHLPLQVSSHFEVKDESEIFNNYFFSLSTGISYVTNFNETLYLDAAPMMDVFIAASESANTLVSSMPFSYGIRIALGYKL